VSAPALRLLTAASCSVCRADRPLTSGLCEHCAPQPVVFFRWLIQYGDVASYIVKPETKALILRLHPEAKVTDLLSLACPACEGSCTDRCDSGAGTYWERQEAERRGITVSQLREEASR